MQSQKNKNLLSSIIINLSLLVLCIVWVVPTLGLVVSSFRPRDEIRSNGWWTVFANPLELTSQLTLENYQAVLAGRDADLGTDEEGNPIRASGDNLGAAFLNSLAVTIPATVIPIAIAAAAAYAFAWMKFPGRRIFFVIVVALLVIPLQLSLIPVLQDYNRWGLVGTYMAVWLAHTGYGLPLAVYLLFNYISQIPKDIMESAAIDGAGHFTTFVRLILPLSTPALASFAIFQFLWVWNDLLVAITYLGFQQDTRVMTIQIQEMVGSRGQDWHLLTAGAFVTMILPLVVFFSLQRYFVRGILAGSVKG